MIGLLDYPKANIRAAIESDVEKTWRIHPNTKEPETVAWIDEYVQKDDVFYDVGANTGAYGFIAASRGAKVYAFEPEALNYARLIQNCMLNPSLDVTPVPLALAERCCIKKLYISRTMPGAGWHRLEVPPNAPEGTYQQTEAITCVTMEVLNSFKIPEPNHIKIDVDGYERFVVDGAQYTLVYPTVKSVMVEIDHKKDDDLEWITGVMRTAGLSEKARWPRSFPEWNHLFVRQF